MGRTTNQYIAAFTINLGSVMYGMILGWVSPSLPFLGSVDSPLESALTPEDGSWVGGLMCLGAIFGTVVFKYVVDTIGRKKAACLLTLPYLINWLCIIFARTSLHIFIARIFAGIGGGGTYLIIPLYVAEIAEDKIRGTLGSFLVLTSYSGVVIVYAVGALVSYNTLSYIMVAVPIFYLVAVSFLPETPRYLNSCGKVEEAISSLKWLRGMHKDIDLIHEDIVSLGPRYKKMQNNKEKLQNENGVALSDLTNSTSMKGFAFALSLMLIQQLSGQFGVVSYAAAIFSEAGSTFSPNMSAIIIGILLIIGAFVATKCVDRFGRKVLLTLSCGGTSVSLIVLATYAYLRACGYNVQSFGWIPVTALSVYQFLFAVGLGPIPFVLVAELFSPKIRALASSICVIFSWFCAFLCIKFFNTLVQAIGLYGCFWFFGGCMAVAALFSWCLLIETRERSSESILEELGGIQKIPKV